MAATRMHFTGSQDDDVSSQGLDDLVAELDRTDIEHPDVAVTHESEWCLSAFPQGLVIWENVEDGDHPRHRAGVSRSEVRHLFGLLAAGDLDAVEAAGWLPGMGQDR